jgi:hypothetical protein
MTEFVEAAALRLTRWEILDVMGKCYPEDGTWAALVDSLDPDKQRRSRWLDLGHHQSRDDAWGRAERLLATKH